MSEKNQYDFDSPNPDIITIAISGAQGSGKTTLINYLKEIFKNNNRIKFVDRKTSRSILNEWGIKLEDLDKDHDLAKKFQEEIFTRKLQDDFDEFEHTIDNYDIVITERSMIDLLTYTLFTLGRNNEVSEWLDDYGNRLLSANKYDLIIHLTDGFVTTDKKLINDGVRGINKFYNEGVDFVMTGLLKKYCDPLYLDEVDKEQLKENSSNVLASSVKRYIELGLPLPQRVSRIVRHKPETNPYKELFGIDSLYKIQQSTYRPLVVFLNTKDLAERIRYISDIIGRILFSKYHEEVTNIIKQIKLEEIKTDEKERYT